MPTPQEEEQKKILAQLTSNTAIGNNPAAKQQLQMANLPILRELMMLWNFLYHKDEKKPSHDKQAPLPLDQKQDYTPQKYFLAFLDLLRHGMKLGEDIHFRPDHKFDVKGMGPLTVDQFAPYVLGQRQMPQLKPEAGSHSAKEEEKQEKLFQPSPLKSQLKRE